MNKKSIYKNLNQINNSERPVDALAEKHPWLTDNLKSRDASASKKSFKNFARACLPGSDLLPVSLQEVSEEVTLSLGLCLFTFAIASLVGPLAVTFIKRNNNKSKQLIVNVLLHRLALFMTLMVLTLPDSLRLEHLGSLVPLFYPLLRLPCHKRMTRRK